MKPLLVGTIAFIMAATSLVSAQTQTMRGNPKAGESIYKQHCLRCHGEKLDGSGPDAQDLIVRPADFTSNRSRMKSDWELLVALTNGVLFSPMHSFRGKLSDEQMLDVLSYIRSVARFDTVS
ncbi:MAG TPA: cytochrome c [Nitrospira sp.]|nr:cytochrome c [Nitrospira sp.]